MQDFPVDLNKSQFNPTPEQANESSKAEEEAKDNEKKEWEHML